MDRRRKVVTFGVVFVGVVALATAGAFVLLAPEPILEWWYLRGLDSTDETRRTNAIFGLAELRSEKAVPKLAAIVETDNTPGVSSLFARLIDEYRVLLSAADPPSPEGESKFLDLWVTELRHENRHFRIYAAYALRCIGVKAKSAVPALMKTHNEVSREYSNSDVDRAFVEALFLVKALEAIEGPRWYEKLPSNKRGVGALPPPPRGTPLSAR